MIYTDETILGFGKYKGKALADVPDAYFIYLYDNGKIYDVGLKAYVRDNYQAMKANTERINQWRKNK